MSDSPQSAVCQRCGRGFVVIDTHRDFLARRGEKVQAPVLCATCFRRQGPLPKRMGKIKWFNARKQYGFIVTDDGEEIFVHQRQILDDQASVPHAGQTARFHVHPSIKGPEALNVELIQAGAPET
jgi:cold shock CspA family protein